MISIFIQPIWYQMLKLKGTSFIAYWVIGNIRFPQQMRGRKFIWLTYISFVWFFFDLFDLFSVNRNAFSLFIIIIIIIISENYLTSNVHCRNGNVRFSLCVCVTFSIRSNLIAIHSLTILFICCVYIIIIFFFFFLYFSFAWVHCDLDMSSFSLDRC